MKSAPATFVVTFRAAAGADGVRTLRATLKFALRRFNLRAIDAHEIPRASPDIPAKAQHRCNTVFPNMEDVHE
jgi:hypothetical protein